MGVKNVQTFVCLWMTPKGIWDNPHFYPLTKTHMVLLTVSINQGSKGNQAENEISFVWNLPSRRGSGIQLSSKKKTSTITYALTGVGDIIYVAKGDNYFNPTCFAFMALLLDAMVWCLVNRILYGETYNASFIYLAS